MSTYHSFGHGECGPCDGPKWLLHHLRTAVTLPMWALLPLGTQTAVAWDTNASIRAAESYTDNHCLSETNKQGEWGTTLTPDFGIKGQTSRASLDLQGSVEFNSKDRSKDDCANRSFGRRGDNNRVNPRLRATGSLELVREMFFIDASAFARQNAVDSFSSYSDSNLNSRGNRNTTYSYRISPTFTSRIGRVADLRLTAGYSDQTNSAREVDDNSRETASLFINSIGGGPFNWGLRGQYTREDYDENSLLPGEENELLSASVTLGYRLDKRWQVNATAGEDFNDFTTVSDEVEGGYWDVGFSWSPNTRTTVDLGYGDRFFGNTYRAAIEYRHRNSFFSLKYTEELTSSRQLREEEVFLALVDEAGNQLFIDGEPLFLETTQTTLTRSPIVEERLQASYKYQARRSSIGFNISISDQKRQADELKTTFSNYDILMDRKLSRNLTINGKVGYQKREADSGAVLGRDSETWRYRVGLSRKLGVNTTMSVDATHVDRSSDAGGEEYKENRITVSVTMNLK